MSGSPTLALLYFGPVLEAQAILWLLIFSYASHSFLLVVQETAAGNDKVIWPDEPWHDRIGKFFSLACLLAFWLLPAYYMLSLFDRVAWFVPVAYGVLWLLFPVSLLSLLSAPAPWMILRPRVLWRLLCHARALVVFYAVTGLVLLLCTCLFGAAVFLGRVELPPVEVDDKSERLGELLEIVVLLGQIFVLPVAALGLAAGLLLYARLLGRLGWLLHGDDLRHRRGAPKSRLPAMPEAGTPAPATAGVAAGPVFLEGEGYEVVEDEPGSSLSTASAESSSATRMDPVPLAVLPPEPVAAPFPPILEVSAFEARMARGSARPRPPRRPLVSGVYGFLLYRTTLRPLSWLSLGNLVVLVILWAVVSALPL